LAKKQIGEHRPFDAPVEVAVAFGFLPPKRPKFAPQHAVRPDLDNLLKAVLDALNGLVWTDDALIWKVMAIKSYSDKNHITVIVNGGYQDDSKNIPRRSISDAELPIDRH
jgi:Holliday junction resolvase RusA-like endonuclease